MMTRRKIIESLKKEYPYLKANFGIKRIGLFGSFAKGNASQDSDVDIVIEFKQPIGLKFMELADYIEKLLARKVDILTPEGIKGIRLKRVASNIKRSILYV